MSALLETEQHADVFREWIRVFSRIQSMFRRAEWYRVQDAELGSWSKTMQNRPPLHHRN